jgi:XTP/dITP diphosphohydrolase
MMPQGMVVVATRNSGKVREFAHALAPMGLTVNSMFDYDGLPAIVEDGSTFAENARIKARTVADALGFAVLADDSGLEVDLLGGEPGVYSARYAGEGADDGANNEKLLRELGRAEPLGEQPPGLPDGVRALSAGRFVCALALYDPSTGRYIEAEGHVDGWIIDRPLGEGGFGYDPLFWVAACRRTMGQLSTDEKRAISHRGEALDKLTAIVKRAAE